MSRADNARENIPNYISDYFQMNGIKIENSLAYAAETNIIDEMLVESRFDKG